MSSDHQKFDSSSFEALKQKIDAGYQMTFEELIKTGNPANEKGHTVAEIMVKQGHIFSIEELIQLNDVNPFSRNIVHIMAERGAIFSFEEIMRSGNPFDKYEYRTLAHRMAKNGVVFTLDEILQLGNPADRAGWTLAHEMAKKGHRFSEDELIKLGNSTTNSGFTVADITFTNETSTQNAESGPLGIGPLQNIYINYAVSAVHKYFKEGPSNPTTCPKCGGYLKRSQLTDTRALEEIFVEMQPFMPCGHTNLYVCEYCHWWFIRENFGDYEIQNSIGEYIIYGVPPMVNKPKYGDTYRDPWVDAQLDPWLYEGKIVDMPDYIYQMFLRSNEEKKNNK